MSTAKLARRMWWVGSLGWGLLASAAVYWAVTDVVLVAGGLPVVTMLTLLLGGAFLGGLASAWFGWFSILTDRVLAESAGPGSRAAVAVALLGLVLSPAALVLVLRSVGDQWSGVAFGTAWLSILFLFACCLGWFRRWVVGYAGRSA